MPRAHDLPLLISREQALTAGLSRHQVTHRVQSGRWRSVRRGWYVDADRFEQLSETDQHLVRLSATLCTRGERDVGSHLSAAVTLGWPTPFSGPGPVTVTSTDLARSARRRESLVVQVASTPPSDVLDVVATVGRMQLGLRITRPARTAADCLRHLPLEDGVAVVDQAVRNGVVTVPEIAAVLARQEPWPYLVNGRRGLELVDPRRESYLESYSLVRLARRGIVAEPQVVIRDTAGGFVARVDAWIDDAAVALECDGRGKYLLQAGDPDDVGAVARSVRSATRDEMRREARLHQLGVTVIRWGTAEVVHRPDALAARVLAAVGRGRRARFTGVAVPSAVPRAA